MLRLRELSEEPRLGTTARGSCLASTTCVGRSPRVPYAGEAQPRPFAEAVTAPGSLSFIENLLLDRCQASITGLSPTSSRGNGSTPTSSRLKVAHLRCHSIGGSGLEDSALSLNPPV